MRQRRMQAQETCYLFQRIVMESLIPINFSATTFLSCLGQQIADISGEFEVQEGSYLFQHLSMLIQHFSAVLIHNSFVDEVEVSGIPAEGIL